MAETRKHRIEVRDELDKAVQAALGAPVRPVEPGAPPASSGNDAAPAASEGAKHTAPFVRPGSTLGAFTFGAAHPTQED